MIDIRVVLKWEGTRTEYSTTMARKLCCHFNMATELPSAGHREINPSFPVDDLDGLQPHRFSACLGLDRFTVHHECEKKNNF